jgi:hypothetical protein
MPLTPVSEVYIGQSDNVTISLGTVECDVMDGSYTIESETDEMTNTGSGGWKESVGTIRRASGSFRIPWRSATPPGWVVGIKYAMIVDVNGANYLSGNVRVTRMEFPGANPKEGVKVMLNWESEGAMSTTRP